MIHVLATIELQPGQRESFLQEMRVLVPRVQAEDGCLEYGPAIDLDTPIEAQPPVRENVVMVVEKWASLEALQAHLDAPHMHAFRERVASMVARLELHILEPA
ncbi:MAG: antibiotic biosynthesis monooxygenase [Planctomycetota bacterium]|nr:MAG: antibiotic biosynthesis monooxygenase [Planctomycetota bacterium]REJ92313.1 MAG: antibiotic biosynthesis monooxygenase [Planctomycetota bacterium]REK30254.1 MAG: antibiotic biosynthesis monooxygenase [Planctomycetota bacterium]REK43446.1 MAG: antibiotic biosynthesis monooxygenase [Planctomycetota bacterium]